MPWSLPTAQNQGLRSRPVQRTSAHPGWAGEAVQGFQCRKPRRLGRRFPRWSSRSQGARDLQVRAAPLTATTPGPTGRSQLSVLWETTSRRQKTNIRFSESPEALGKGEQHFKSGEPKLEEVSWQPRGQLQRQGADEGLVPHPRPEAGHSRAPQPGHLPLFSEDEHAICVAGPQALTPKSPALTPSQPC